MSYKQSLHDVRPQDIRNLCVLTNWRRQRRLIQPPSARKQSSKMISSLKSTQPIVANRVFVTAPYWMNELILAEIGPDKAYFDEGWNPMQHPYVSKSGQKWGTITLCSRHIFDGMITADSLHPIRTIQLNPFLIALHRHGIKRIWQGAFVVKTIWRGIMSYEVSITSKFLLKAWAGITRLRGYIMYANGDK